MISPNPIALQRPGHRAAVSIHESRAPGRYWVVSPLDTMYRFLALFIAVAWLGCGCATAPLGHSSDIRSSLLASAKRSDPDFPDGHNMVLTHFSHVGQLVSSGGEIIYVADRRAVIAGMLAPRGQNYITFFDDHFRYLGKVGYVSSRPLWREGSRLYLFGDFDGFATGLSGNVLDVARGYGHITAYHARAYGSSGGIND